MSKSIIPVLSKLLFPFFILILCIQIICVCGGHIYENEEKYKQLDEWRSPGLEMEKNFTYYLAGHDYNGRPVWILEVGKWLISQVPAYIANNLDSANDKSRNGDLWDTYIDQMMFRLHNSPAKYPKKYEHEAKSNSTETDIGDDEEVEKISNGWVLVGNMDGYDLKELTSTNVIPYGLRMAKKLEAATSNMEYGYIVNVNYFASAFINLLKPVLGNVMAKLDIYGTRSQVWKPKLFKKIPKQELSGIIGGGMNPVIAYG